MPDTHTIVSYLLALYFVGGIVGVGAGVYFRKIPVWGMSVGVLVTAFFGLFLRIYNII